MDAAQIRPVKGYQNRLGMDSAELTCRPTLSSQDLGWKHIQVGQFQHSPGECNISSDEQHTMCVSLATRPVRFLQIKDGKTHRSLYGKGDISIATAT